MAAEPEYCFLWMQTWVTCSTKSEWAAWTQAMFSVVAICAAGIGVYWQVRRAEQLTTDTARRAESSAQRALIDLVTQAHIAAAEQHFHCIHGLYHQFVATNGRLERLAIDLGRGAAGADEYFSHCGFSAMRSIEGAVGAARSVQSAADLDAHLERFNSLSLTCFGMHAAMRETFAKAKS